MNIFGFHLVQAMTQKMILRNLLIICIAVTAIPHAYSQVEIKMKTGNDREQQTKDQLQRLMKEYDISKWLFTTSINVEDGYDVIPHSHPILTLNTRHLKDDELLLSTLVHEQMHWYLEKKPDETKKALASLKELFPQVPVGFPEGANDEMSSYIHLLVCYMELQADRQLFGET